MNFTPQSQGLVLVRGGPSRKVICLLGALLFCCLSGFGEAAPAPHPAPNPSHSPANSSPSQPRTRPNTLSASQRQFLRHWFGLNERALSVAATGEPVALALPGSDAKELAVAGLVWMDAPLSAFVQSQRLLAERDGNRHVRGAALFSQPPHLDDLSALRLDAKDLADLARCRPADCGLKLYAQDLHALRAPGIPAATSPDAWNSRFRRILLQRVAAYQQGGNQAMGAFGDKPQTTIAAREFEQVLAHSPYLQQVSPQFHAYLERYPAQRPDGAEDHFYWSHVEFGLKPTVRLNHLVVYQNPHPEVPWLIASKQILSTHYLQAALELRMVLLPPGGDGRHGFYLLTVNRSRNDGLDSPWSGLLRRILRSKAVEGVARYLAFTRNQAQAPAPPSSNAKSVAVSAPCLALAPGAPCSPPHPVASPLR